MRLKRQQISEEGRGGTLEIRASYQCPTSVLDDWMLSVFVDLLSAPEEQHAELLADLQPFGETYQQVMGAIPLHLGRCDRCREVYDASYQLKEVLEEAAREDTMAYDAVSFGLTERVMEAAQAYGKRYALRRQAEEALNQRKKYH